MTRRTKVLAAAAFVVAAAAGTGIGIATMGDSDEPITGDAYDRATRAALEHVGDGVVTDTEAGDEEGAYEVEITLPDGSQIDVHLDAGFNVIGAEPDDEAPDDDGDD